MTIFKKTMVGIVALLVLFSAASCDMLKDKEPVSEEEFIEAVEDADWDYRVVTDQYDEDDGVETAILAGTDDFKIEFYIVESEEQAERAYANNKDYFENDLPSGGASSNSTINVANYSRYVTTKGGVFAVISRIGNTFIYVEVGEEYKGEVVPVLENLGY
ncbi:MAG: hypothetical protein JW817_01755 [Clostridiales bacterium]|nr:hypothetical protein [Clostridiales bacterium]